MILHNRPRLWALALGLALVGWFTGVAQADATYSYRTIGEVNVPTGVSGGLVYFDGLSSGTVTPPGSVNLGTFNVSTLASTTNATYSNTPFEIVAMSGSNAGSDITGVINGSIGPSATNPGLTATINAITPYGDNALPFNLQLPLNTPLTLALSDGNGGTGQTSLTGVSITPVPVPEPTSLAVFAVALGGLGLWGRRRVGR
jgi:hypothetical protein